MYCQKCGTENLGDAQVCAGCGGVFVHSKEARTSAMAVTSMVLGVSGFSVFGAAIIAWIMGLTLGIVILSIIGLSMSGVSGVTWVIGLVFGIMALNKITKNSGKIKGRGWAATGIVTSSVGLGLVLTIFGIWMILTSVRTVTLREQVVDLKNIVATELIEGTPSIEGAVVITDSRGTGSSCDSALFDAKIIAESSGPVISSLACGPGEETPTEVTWSFAGIKGEADVYNFKVVFPVITGVPLVTINKTMVYDGGEQVVYEDDTAKVVIMPQPEKD